MRISDLTHSIAIDTNKKFRYRRISKESIKFIDIFKNVFKNISCKDYNKCIKDDELHFNPTDFIITLRSHLFMKKYSTILISDYFCDVIYKNLHTTIHSQLEPIEHSNNK